MSRISLVLLFLLGAACVHAQWGYSYITADPGTGQLAAWGQTEADGGSGAIFVSANVCTYIAGQSSDCGMDNCGMGCAWVVAYGNVFALGLQYTEFSQHQINGVDYEGVGFQSTWGTQDSTNVPPAPQISLQSIDATNPHGVFWNYSVVGPPLFTQVFELGSIVQISNYLSSFQVDQNAYPYGNNLAYMTGFAYGIAIPAPPCAVNRFNSGSAQDHSALIPDGSGNGFIAVHHTNEVAFGITYCIQPSPQGYPTQVAEAAGAIDTRDGDFPVAAIQKPPYGPVELHIVGGYTDQLPQETRPTLPGQGPQYQAYDIMYPNLWLPPGLTAQICNNVLYLTAYDGSPVITFPLGCNSHPLP